MERHFDERVQKENDAVSIMDARNDDYDYVKSIARLYSEEDEDDFDEGEMGEVVLNGTVPTGIANTGALAHCGQQSTSTCGRFKLNTNSFIPTSKKSNIFYSKHCTHRQHQTPAFWRAPHSGRGAYGVRHQAQSFEYEPIFRSKIHHNF